MDKFDIAIQEYANSNEVSIEEARQMLLFDYGSNSLHGYGIFTDSFTNALHIERIDELGVFNSDIEASKQAKQDGIKLIPYNEQPKRGSYKYYRFIDTAENRLILQSEVNANLSHI